MKRFAVLATLMAIVMMFGGVVAYACHPIITVDCNGFTIKNSDSGTFPLTVKVDGVTIFGPQSTAAPFTKTWTWAQLSLDHCGSHKIVATWNETPPTVKYNGTSCPCCTDTTPPVISRCPGSISVNNTPGQCGAVVSWTPPTATDNCSLKSLTTTVNPGTVFSVGTTTVTYTAEDSKGNKSYCIFTVTVVDAEKPAITLTGGDMTVECSSLFTDPGATATDNCCVGSVVVTGTVNTSVPGDYVLYYNATDCHGNTAVTVTRTVHVVDTIAPVIAGCPRNISVNNDAGQCGATVWWPLPTASDACCPFSFGSDWLPGSLFPVGSTVVTYTARDCNGHVTTCSFTVTVTDAEKPVITLNGSASVILECGIGTYTEQGATVTDNCCGGAVVVGGDTVNTSICGTYTVTYDATDCHGNMANRMTRAVVVVDTAVPIITLNGPSSLTLECGGGTYVEWGASMTDACCPASLVIGGDAVNASSVGTYVITYDATDCNGNHAVQKTRTVRVVDTTPPVITLNGGDMTLECGINSYTERGATVSDSCCPGPLVVTGKVDTTKVGTYTVDYNATDCCGNAAATKHRTVSVVDTMPPAISGCHGDIVIANETGLCGAHGTWAEPTASDACCLDSFTSDHKPGEFFPVGATLVTYTARDCNGHSVTCSFTVTVGDNEAPALKCPGNITLECGQPTDPGHTGQATATDNCGISTLVHDDTESGTCTKTIVRTWKATDIHGNAVQCGQVITVKDKTSPALVCPANATVKCGASTSPDATGWATATDGCSGVLVSYTDVVTKEPPTLTRISRTWTATDGCGNVSTGVQVITMECPCPELEDIVVTWPFGCCDCTAPLSEWPLEWPPARIRVLDLANTDWEVTYPEATAKGGRIERFYDTLYYIPSSGAANDTYILDSFEVHVTAGKQCSDTIKITILALRRWQREMIWSFASAADPDMDGILEAKAGQQVDIFIQVDRALLGLGRAELVFSIGDTSVARVAGASVVGLPERCFTTRSLDAGSVEFLLDDAWLGGKGLVKAFDSGGPAVVKVTIEAAAAGRTSISLSMKPRVGTMSSVYDMFHTLVGWQLCTLPEVTLIVGP